MRINQYIASATAISRRMADKLISDGKVSVNNNVAQIGQTINSSDKVKVDGREISLKPTTTTLILNKPTGFVVSRNGQGCQTIYDILPENYHHLKPVGRLDKDSCGLLLLTDDGELANQLTHPKFQKRKVYNIKLDKPLSRSDLEKINSGLRVQNYISHLHLSSISPDGLKWKVEMSEGKNRQIRNTLATAGYRVIRLERVAFGDFLLGDLKPGQHREHKFSNK